MPRPKPKKKQRALSVTSASSSSSLSKSSTPASPSPRMQQKGRGSRRLRAPASAAESDASSQQSNGDEHEENAEGIVWPEESFAAINGAEFYQRVVINNKTFAVGDVVSVMCLTTAGKESFCLAIIESLFEEKRDKFAEARWLVYARDEKLKGPASDQISSEEVFETDCIDEVELEAINNSEVLGTNVFNLPADAYLCRYFLSKTLGTFRPRGRIVPGIYSRRLKNHRRLLEQLHGSGGALSGSVSAEDDASALLTGRASGDGGRENDSFAKASKLLQLSAIPATLPCRDKELKEIRSALEGGIRRGGDQHALYISGLPGTGKTATVHEVLRSLQQDKTMPKFDLVEINGATLTSPNEAYTVILEALTGARAVPERASVVLESLFSSPARRQRVCVLLVDEMDHLVTSKQTLLYSIFDWPSRANAKLVVVGIANTMDLPERLLPRIASRIGKLRVTFKPYTKDEIVRIVRGRLGDVATLFDPDSIDMCARKVASLSGDIRRGLILIRRAAEICQRQGRTQVKIEHVNQAVRELDAKLFVRQVVSASLYEKLLLLAVQKCCSQANAPQASFDEVIDRFELLVNLVPMPQAKLLVPCKQLLADNVHKLTNLGLLKSTRIDQRTFCRLNFDEDDLHLALQQDDDLKTLV